MTPVTFRGYGVTSSEVTIVIERIVSWVAVDYNGRHGTLIALDNGKEIVVDAWPIDVERTLIAAKEKK